MLSVRTDYRDIEVRLPQRQVRFGEKTMLRIAGNPDGPAVVVLGGISGSRFVCRGPAGGAGWWPGFVEEGCAIDPQRYKVVGFDFAADPTGGSAPSTEDQAYVLAAALEAAGIGRAHAMVGASYGGMVTLRFAETFPAAVGKLVIVSAPAEPHPAATATRELQRRMVALGLKNGVADEALSIARGMAMLTYRTPQEFGRRFCGGLQSDDPLTVSQPGAYLRSRGEAFRDVMSPGRFLSLCASIDRHCSRPEAIGTPALVIGARSDQLVPPDQLRSLVKRLGGGAGLHLIDSPYGHDMFLKQAAEIGRIVAPFLEAGL